MADVDNESDVSFESADEGEGAGKNGGDDAPPGNDVSQNVKKKEDDPPLSESTMQESTKVDELDKSPDEKDDGKYKPSSIEQESQNEDGVKTVDDVAADSVVDAGEKVETTDGAGSGMSDNDPTEVVDSERTRTEESDQAEDGDGHSSPVESGATSKVSETAEGDRASHLETDAIQENSKNAEIEGETEPPEVTDNKEGAESLPANQSIDRTDPTEGEMPEGGAPSGQGSWGAWGGSWSGWGSSLYSSATATVSAVSGSVGKVIGNVESSLGVPPAEDMASKTDTDTTVGEEAEGKKENGTDGDVADPSAPRTSPGAAVGSLFSYSASAVTSVVSKTVTGGLDALEVIGKKTMDVLQEGDPGFKKTKAYFGNKKDGQNLSQLLREAKEEAEVKAHYLEEEEERQKCHFGWLFEQNQGLAHLEALEILSNESENKVEAVVGMTEDVAMETLKTELMEIKDAFELEDIETEEADDDADFVNTITEHLFSLSIAAKPDKLRGVQTDAHEWLAKLDGDAEGTEAIPGAKEIHQKAMQVLADLTARSIEQFHKTGELLLLKQVTEENKSPIQQATSLSKLTSALCAEVSFVASKFSEKLSKMAATCTDGSGETINGFITNIFLEASNSTSYIQDAFQLLLPVMQVVAIDQKQDSQT